MTRPRIYGEDSPFGGWFRNEPRLDSIDCSLSVTDRDYHVHHFKTRIDSVGTRTVQLMMDMELKTRGGLPKWGQHQSLFFEHQLLNQKRKLLCSRDGDLKSVWHFGYFVLSLLGDRPEPDSYVTWCRFSQHGALVANTITTDDLIRVLRFDIRPDTLEPLELRRHHKTRRLLETVTAPLGFAYQRLVTRKS
jgi:hypothetical protein